MAKIRVDGKFWGKVRKGYEEDKNIKDTLQRVGKAKEGETVDSFSIKDGILYKNRRITISNSPKLRLTILHDLHNSPTAGHLGWEKTLELVVRTYYWDGML